MLLLDHALHLGVGVDADRSLDALRDISLWYLHANTGLQVLSQGDLALDEICDSLDRRSVGHTLVRAVWRCILKDLEQRRSLIVFRTILVPKGGRDT